MRLRLLKAIVFSTLLLLLSLSPVLSATQDSQPLRPFPFELTSEEKSRSISDPYLTRYCAQRPTAVQTNRLDKRDKTLTLTVAGDFTSNLSSFITPLLSVTDPDSPHATLSAELKAKGYLADFLEGRAYYEPQAEPQNPNFSEGGFLSRLGVFRKLAPETYQDQLKRALIKRAKKDFSIDNNPYGFTPASLSVQNYTIACWNASKNQVVSFQNYDKKNCTSGSPIKLGHFNQTNWAPLPEEFATPLEFASASAKWKIKDGGQKNADGKIIEHGKWSQLWPYVPMFSREDTQGWVRSLPEPGQQNDQVIEKPVIHPHLARTYEVSSAFSYLLSPQSTHDYPEDPKLITYWNVPPWTRPDNKDWWIDSGHNESQWSLSAGPVCDPNNTIVASSGDLAKEGIIESSVNKTVTDLENLEYDPNCATTKTIEISPGVYETITDDSDCYINQPVRFSPIYLKTFTPFLNEIINNLVDGPRAFFNTFNLDKEVEPKEGPGVGYPDEPSLAYSFTGGEAEAGMKQPGSPAKFFYKGLGYIQCQKERLLATLQPFLTGKPYTYFSPECLENKTLDGLSSLDDLDDWQKFLDSLSPDQLQQFLNNLSGVAGLCPAGGEEITDKLANRMKNGLVRLLPNTLGARSTPGRFCITPTMIVIHWSGGWDNDDANDRTWNTLVTRNLACQLGSDANDTTLMQPFYETQVEFPWCASAFNTFSINNEIGGGFLKRSGGETIVDIRFTDEKGYPSRLPPGNPNKPRQRIFPTKLVFDHAIDATCVIMKQYNIPWSQIYGHYHVPGAGKSDPGKEFLEDWFIPTIKNKCG